MRGVNLLWHVAKVYCSLRAVRVNVLRKHGIAGDFHQENQELLILSDVLGEWLQSPQTQPFQGYVI